MDDGYHKNKNCILATESFQQEDRQQLLEKLKSFGVEAILRLNGKIRIRSKSLPKFFELVKPYMHSSMYYKIPDGILR